MSGVRPSDPHPAELRKRTERSHSVGEVPSQRAAEGRFPTAPRSVAGSSGLVHGGYESYPTPYRPSGSYQLPSHPFYHPHTHTPPQPAHGHAAYGRAHAYASTSHTHGHSHSGALPTAAPTHGYAHMTHVSQQLLREHQDLAQRMYRLRLEKERAAAHAAAHAHAHSLTRAHAAATALPTAYGAHRPATASPPEGFLMALRGAGAHATATGAHHLYHHSHSSTFPMGASALGALATGGSALIAPHSGMSTVTGAAMAMHSATRPHLMDDSSSDSGHFRRSASATPRGLKPLRTPSQMTRQTSRHSSIHSTTALQTPIEGAFEEFECSDGESGTEVDDSKSDLEVEQVIPEDAEVDKFGSGLDKSHAEDEDSKVEKSKEECAADVKAGDEAAATRMASKRSLKGKLHFPDKDMDGRYIFVRYLGHGSYGHVCQARRLSDGLKVAIKKVPRVFRNATDAKRLLRELRILRLLKDHEAVVDLIDILPPNDVSDFNVLYLVFEFVDTDLAQLINSQQYFQNLHAQYITYQILLGLKYMHSANIVHRDLKPANVLVNENVSVKICDFGLARCITNNTETPKPKSRGMVEISSPVVASAQRKIARKALERKESGVGHRSELTRHVVTRWYRAPEVILFSQQRSHLNAIDMWSVGCILSELLMMLRENVSDPKSREPLFPGRSCFPLSARDSEAYKDRMDQLNVIFEVIGTPSHEEIERITDPQARLYLQKLPTKRGLNLARKFPGSSREAIDLLRRLLTFDASSRITVDEALTHPYLKDVRDRSAEKKRPTLKFDFEDVPLDMMTLYELIVDEIMHCNSSLLLPKAGTFGLAAVEDAEEDEFPPPLALTEEESGKTDDMPPVPQS